MFRILGTFNTTGGDPGDVQVVAADRYARICCGNLRLFIEKNVTLHTFDTDNACIWLGGELFNEKKESLFSLIQQSLVNEALVNQTVRSLNGSFFLIYLHKPTNRLRIYTDQMALQPIYYFIHHKQLYFSDKLAPLVHVDPSFTPAFKWLYALSYSEYGNIFENGSLFEEISIVRPGHFIEATQNATAITETAYWRITQEMPLVDAGSTVALIEQFKSLLDDSVRVRSNPNGATNIFVSGGLDSSAVAFFASRVTKLKGVSILNPLTYQVFDTQRVLDLSEKLSFETLFFLLSYKTLDVAPDEWELLLKVTETPVLDLSHLIKLEIYSTLLKNDMIESNQFLSGFGSDQFIGGITRTTLNAKGFAFDTENHWDAYYAVIKRVRLDHYLEKSLQAAGEFHAYLNPDLLASQRDAFIRNAWHFQMFKQQYLFNKKTIRPEVNIASHFNQQILFPYLDHRLINFIGALPEETYKELLFDKMILRKIFIPEKALTGVADPKMSIYVDNRQNPTLDFYYNLLYRKGDGLAWKAIEELNGLKEFFNVADLTREITGLEKKKDRSFTKWLMNIVNCILLNASLRRSQIAASVKIPSPPVITDTELRKNTSKVEAMMGIDKPADSQIITKVLRLSEETMVLQNKENRNYYISKNAQIIFEIEKDNKDIIDFLTKHAGKGLAAEEIIEHNNLNKKKIIAFITEALSTGVLEEYGHNNMNQT